MQKSIYERRLKIVLENPTATYEQLGALFGVSSKATVHAQLSKFRRDERLNWRDRCAGSFTTNQTKPYADVTEQDQAAIITAIVDASKGLAISLPENLWNVYSRFSNLSFPRTVLRPFEFKELFADCSLEPEEIENLRLDLKRFLKNGEAH